jgi:transposase-like protein
MTKKKKKQSTRGKRGTRTWAYPVGFRLKIVKLALEEGYSAPLLAEQFGISRSAIRRWIRLYRQCGVEGLEIKRRTGTPPRVPPEVRRRMVAVKKAHPEYGPRRIADVLKRFFPDSHESIQRTQNVVRQWPGKQGQTKAEEESNQAPVLRAIPSQPVVAKRHHDLPAGRMQRLCSRRWTRAIESRDDHEGALRSSHRPSGSRPDGRVAQDLLQAGKAGFERPAGQCYRLATGSPGPSLGRPNPGFGKAVSPGASGNRSVELCMLTQFLGRRLLGDLDDGRQLQRRALRSQGHVDPQVP